MIVALLAVAVLMPPETARSLRCVAVLAVAPDAKSAPDAAFFTAIVGAEAMDATGQTRETVRDLIVDQVRRVRADPGARNERAACTAQMKARVALERAAPK